MDHHNPKSIVIPGGQRDEEHGVVHHVEVEHYQRHFKESE